jgi:hypothetical protein
MDQQCFQTPKLGNVVSLEGPEAFLNFFPANAMNCLADGDTVNELVRHLPIGSKSDHPLFH